MSSPVPPRFRPSPDALATRVGEEIVLVHTRTDKIYVLNRTGARVWELLSDDLDRAGIAERLEGEFEVTRVQVAAEVDDVLRSLVAARLIAARDDG